MHTRALVQGGPGGPVVFRGTKLKTLSFGAYAKPTEPQFLGLPLSTTVTHGQFQQSRESW